MSDDAPLWTRRDWVLVLAVSAALRAAVAFVLLRGMPPMFDAGDYVSESLRFMERGWGSEPIFWPPGMPLFLVPFFKAFGPQAPFAVGLAGIVIGLGTVWLVVRVTLEALGDARAAHVAGWIAACYPPMLLMTGQPYAHALASVALLAACLAAIRFLHSRSWGSAMLAGLALGVATLSRPSSASVVVAFALGGALLVLRAEAPLGRRLVRLALVGLLFGGAALLPLLPAVRHNLAVGAGATISTNNGWNLLAGNNPFTPDYKTWHLAQRGGDAWPGGFRALVDSLRSQPAPDAAMRDYAVRFMTEHPVLSAKRSFNRGKSFWGADYLGSRLVQLHRGTGLAGVAAFLLVEAGSFVAVVVLAIWGVGRVALRGWRPGATVLVLTVVAYQAPYVISFAPGVFHWAVIALLFPFAAVGTGHLPLRDGAEPLRGRASLLSLAAIALFLLAQVEYVREVFRMSGA